jgi:ribose 5-phosphate isomerase A
VQRAIRSTFGVEAVLRGAGEPYITDNGNVLFDCAFGSIEDPAALDAQLRALHGVVDTGLFTGLTDAVLVDRDGGVEVLVRP